MVALLSASGLSVWRRCYVDACWLRILFTVKAPTATKKAICVPESLLDGYSLEVADRVGDRPVHEHLGDVR
jgi:hypothetical protein